jgi:hypothetical protein
VSGPELVRPRYREGQQLTADDLGTEQDYLLATRREHDGIAHHPGIAHGLGLSAQTSGFTVAPGVAVDGNSRAIALPSPVRLRWADLPADAAALDVWLRYREDTVGDRVTEGAAVQAVPVQPAAAPAAPGQASSPPVYLGRLASNQAAGPPYVPVESKLSYIGTQAASLAAQTGTQLVLDVEPALTVLVPDAGGHATARLAVSTAQGTKVDGDVVTPAARLAADQPLCFSSAVPAPQQAWPWRWYRAETRADGVVTGQALRIELAAPARTDVPEWYRFAVADGSGSFPLSVNAGCTTTIGGHLTVKGPLVLGPLGADPTDPRLVGALVDTWVDAIDEVSRAVDEKFSGDLIDMTALAVTLAVVPPVGDATPTRLTYDLKVSNRSANQITDLAIVAVTTVNAARDTTVIAHVPTLAAGADHELTHEVALPGAGATVRVEIVALGLLPGGRIALAMQDVAWQDTPPDD